MKRNDTVIRRATMVLLGPAALVAMSLATVSGVASADPGIGWGAPGPGILPGPGHGGFGGPASGLGLLPGVGWGLRLRLTALYPSAFFIAGAILIALMYFYLQQSL
jgi:hypothetical protein